MPAVARSRFALAWCLALAVAAACADEPDPIETGGATTGSGPASSGSATSAGAGGGPDATPTGVPCEVADVLAARCTSCHSDPPRSSAPVPLVTREDLLAPSAVDPAQSYAERAVVRMRAGTMPATGGAEADADVIDAWLAAGAPSGGCGDGGGGGGGTAPDPFAEPSACVSGETWTSDEEGDEMNPGEACLSCHREDDGPDLILGGTVYPNGHAPDDCYGIDGRSGPYADVQVWITDARGTTHRLDVGRTGNFLLEEADGFAMPYTAKVVDLSVDPPAERAMGEAQEHGDCNLCHTEDGGGDGSDAPGRILIPLLP